MGIKADVQAVKALIVRRLRDGGQSIKMISYDSLISSMDFFNLKSLPMAPTSSTSAPVKSKLEGARKRSY